MGRPTPPDSPPLHEDGQWSGLLDVRNKPTPALRATPPREGIF